MNPKKFWLVDATVVTQNAKRDVYFRGSVCVENGRITEVLEGAPTAAVLKDRSARISLKGQILMPGLIQPHTHLCQTLFRNHADDLELLDWLSHRVWPMEARHSAESIWASAVLGISELLGGGTTTILDMGTLRHTSAILEAIESTGIRAVAGKCLMDRPETCPHELIEETDAGLQESEKLFKRWHGRDGGRIQMSYAPRFAVSCTRELLERVGDLAREKKALIHTHSSENRGEIELVKKLTGFENIEFFHKLGLTGERLVLAHCIWLSAREEKILADTGTRVVHCPSSNLKLASGIAAVPRLLKNRVTVGLAADGAPCNNQLSAWQEMRLAALIQKPEHGARTMPAQAVLDLATLGGARVLGQESTLGSIEVGKRADFCVVERDAFSRWTGGASQAATFSGEALVSSLVYSTDASHVASTWVDGREVYRRGKGLLRLSTRSLVKDLEKAWKRMVVQ